MIQEVEKQLKVALCRKCRGTGTLNSTALHGAGYL